ncbi:hypothetical protein DFH08DRAFT_659431, partial [Mycena albidolilacea]
VEECGGVAEWLTWVNSGGGEAVSPCHGAGRSCSSLSFFDYLMKEKDAWDAVQDVRGWIV